MYERPGAVLSVSCEGDDVFNACVARQLDRILEIGAIRLVTRHDWKSVVAADLGQFRVIIDGLHFGATGFIHKVVVVTRQKSAVTGGGKSGSWRIFWCILTNEVLYSALPTYQQHVRQEERHRQEAHSYSSCHYDFSRG